MYPAELVKPMREQLTVNGFKEMFSEKDVDDLIEKKVSAILENQLPIILDNYFKNKK